MEAPTLRRSYCAPSGRWKRSGLSVPVKKIAINHAKSILSGCAAVHPLSVSRAIRHDHRAARFERTRSDVGIQLSKGFECAPTPADRGLSAKSTTSCCCMRRENPRRLGNSRGCIATDRSTRDPDFSQRADSSPPRAILIRVMTRPGNHDVLYTYSVNDSLLSEQINYNQTHSRL